MEETLRTIERRARLYRRLVQALVLTGAAMTALVVFVSGALLLYAPAAAVLLVSGWAAMDAAELERWRRRMVDFGVAIDRFTVALKTRADVPQATVAEMVRSLTGAARSPARRALLISLALVLGLACAARALQVRSMWWGTGAIAGFLTYLFGAKIRLQWLKSGRQRFVP